MGLKIVNRCSNDHDDDDYSDNTPRTGAGLLSQEQYLAE